MQSAIAELKYRPDAFAQSLRKRTSNTIGVIIPDIRNPFFAELMQCIEIRARALGYSVLFVSSDEDPAAETEHIEAFAARKVDGILLLPSNRATSAPHIDGVPIVVVDRPIKGHPAVAADNRGGARLAVEYLVSLGHRRIACIAGPKDSITAKSRLAGFLDVMTSHYRTARLQIADFVAHGDFDYAGGQSAAQTRCSAGRRCVRPPSSPGRTSRRSARSEPRPTAALVVPSDLSVVGFDGILLSDLVTPRLTTVVQPVAKIAEVAVALVLGAGPMSASDAPNLLECELVVRNSCAPPPAASVRPSILRQKGSEAGTRLALSWPPSLAIQDLETFHRPPNLHKSRF